MSETATVVEIRRLRPVKWSVIDKKAGSFRDGLVKTFLEYEGRPLLDEDGEPLLDGRGAHREVTISSFSERFGIARGTFSEWVFERRGYSAHPNSRVRTDNPIVPDTSTVTDRPYHRQRIEPAGPTERTERHGMCSCCPEWKGE